MAESLINFRQQFENLTKNPEDFLSIQNDVAAKVSALLKSIYDFTKSEEKESNAEALPELIVDDFDEEQIWQELELQNTSCMDSLVRDVAKIISLKQHLAFPFANNKIDGHNEDDMQNEEKMLEDQNDDNSLDASGSEKQEEKLDDDQKDDMDQSGEDDGTSADDNDMFFRDIPNDEDLFYSDVFGKEPPEENAKTLMEEEDGDEDEDDNEENSYDNENEDESLNKEDKKRVRFDLQEEVKSNLEQRQERLKAKIEQLEEAALAEKPWQLKGEVSATSRPQNSLLEEVLEFDLTTRPPPVITEKTTQKLEDVILQRIKDKAWDDVERKIKPIETPNEYKKKLVLDQEKSKLSLAEIYEKEYIKEREKALGDEDKESEEPPEYQQIRSMMSSLFAKLDALSNFHYTPKPPAPEVKIVSNLPAITMEEVAPVAASDAALLAPEEVKAHPKGDIKGKEERTKTDKKRERRLKKARQRAKQHEREKRELALQKEPSGVGKKYSKLQALHDVKRLTRNTNISKMEVKDEARKAVKSSTAFFNQLQDEVRSHIKAQTKTKDVDKRKALSAKKIKL